VGLLLFLAAAGSDAATGEPKRVLILQSFGRDFAPWNAISPAFKTELAQQWSGTIEFHEAALETARVDQPQTEVAFAEYLRALFAQRQPDLVVPIGPPAAQFWLRHRDGLAPATPMVIGGIDQWVLRTTVPVGSNDAAVTFRTDSAAVIEVILHVFPETTNIAIVFGNSPHEQFAAAAAREAWQRFTNRIQFIWLNELPLTEMCRRGAALPPRSALGFGSLVVDAAGVPYEQTAALDKLCTAANAPVFGLFEEQLGHGIIGGRLFSGEALGRAAGQLAARVLRGETAGNIQVPVIGMGPAIFDWRELQRWRVSENRLPSGSIVRFRQPSVWEQYRWYILGALAVISAQAATIAGLLMQRVWRRRTEKSAREVSGRLITAQEEERRRIARDLHDDLNQRLALLSVELELAGHGPAVGPPEMTSRLDDMAAHVKDMSSEVHKLSYQLHPAKLDQLGLVVASRTFCAELSAQSGVRIGFTHQNIPRDLPAEMALCLYRVLQEATGNAARHSGAAEARADLRLDNGHIQLTVSDAGKGFDLARARREGGLGLMSMQERARLLSGQLKLDSEPGRGTCVELTIPLATVHPTPQPERKGDV